MFTSAEAESIRLLDHVRLEDVRHRSQRSGLHAPIKWTQHHVLKRLQPHIQRDLLKGSNGVVRCHVVFGHRLGFDVDRVLDG